VHLAVISDIHGNLPALEAVLADISRRGVNEVVNLGDCVLGPLWPRETCALLMRRGFPTVRGNTDRAVATLAPADMTPLQHFTRGQLEEAQRRWLGDLPATLRLDPGVLAVHGGPDDDNRYLLEDVAQGRLVRGTAQTIAERLGPTDARLVLCGHSHQQHMVRLPEGPLVLNPGSVGLSDIGSPHARYALVSRDNGAMTIELVALDYDHASAVNRAAANDSPRWAYMLTTGFAPPARA
jgi:predicted phosphodiesterase